MTIENNSSGVGATIDGTTVYLVSPGRSGEGKRSRSRRPVHCREPGERAHADGADESERATRFTSRWTLTESQPESRRCVRYRHVTIASPRPGGHGRGTQCKHEEEAVSESQSYVQCVRERAATLLAEQHRLSDTPMPI